MSDLAELRASVERAERIGDAVEVWTVRLTLALVFLAGVAVGRWLRW